MMLTPIFLMTKRRIDLVGSYLVDTVTLRMDKGNDQWQEPNTPEDASVKAFVEYGEWQMQNEMGQVIVSKTRVLMRPRTIIVTGFAARAANTISYKDKVIIDGILHAIAHIGKLRDFSVRGFAVYVT